MTASPLKIDLLQKKQYPPSELTFEQNLPDEDGYTKQIVSYSSDGLKIYALLTIPKGDGKFPLVVFNRGYVDPVNYQSDRQYLRYLDHFARNGFVVFKSDYRGIGQSEGESQSVTSSANSSDVLNGLASLGQVSQIDFDKCFIWGHSMGGMVSLQCLLVSSTNITTHPRWLAGSLWAGFIIPYDQILTRWQNSSGKQKARADEMLAKYGDPKVDSRPWHEISPYYFLDQLPCPIQLHHGTLDSSIPESDSIEFEIQLKKVGKSAGAYLYPQGGHNLSGPELTEAMEQTIKFFKSKL